MPVPPDVVDDIFRAAAAAIDAGDDAGLRRLLEGHPWLATRRLEAPGAWLAEQHATALAGFFARPFLMWFLADDLARHPELPGNVAQLARTIVEQVRRVDPDSLQQQLDGTLYLAVCSPVGRRSGLQLQLIDVLIDAGASLDRRATDAGGIAAQALICLNASAAEHLVERGAELTLPVAACLERWPETGDLLERAGLEERQFALALAALNGKARGLSALVAAGADLDAFATGFYTHATPLHHAVSSGSLAAVRVLVEAGARLDTLDKAWGGSPLDWAEHLRGVSTDTSRSAAFEEIAGYLQARSAGER